MKFYDFAIIGFLCLALIISNSEAYISSEDYYLRTYANGTYAKKDRNNPITVTHYTENGQQLVELKDKYNNRVISNDKNAITTKKKYNHFVD